MERLASIENFHILQEHLASIAAEPVPTIIISAGTCGQASGAGNLIRAAKRAILEYKLAGRVHLRVTGCHGYCQMEPSILIEPSGVFYPRLTPNQVEEIVLATAEGRTIEELLYRNGSGAIARQSDLPFFKLQTRRILARNEKVDPIRIFDYIAAGGYKSLASVLERGNSAWVVEQVKVSGLRGRGGAGFPTGRKWELLAKQPGARGKFLVCNADEGDPGAYMDRSVLEGNPHLIIEGMVIGAYATGASEGVVYVRNEYPLAIKHLTIALRQARELGMLGRNILGAGLDFDVNIVRGAGAFVCGEETALIASIEGRMGEPHQRPPYPVQKGIDGRPTVINNVETWANVPIIFEEGAENFKKTGTDGNSGTKIFSLVGKVKNTGLVEAPMGTPLSEIVYEIGGGPSGSAKIKAVQTGGPSGGCIPAEKFHLPIDYDSLVAAGTIMGSGGMIVMDDDTCMVDVAKYFMKFLKDESCGKCFTCRKGTQRMWEILDDIASGRGTLEQISLLEELALVVKDTTMCGLGQSAPNPVLSTLRYFKSEFERHVIQKRCDAFVCKELVGAPCHSACPIGTEAWRYVAHIARGEFDQAYIAIREANPFPSVCARVCDHQCEIHCKLGKSGSRPVAIRALKRFITDHADPLSYKPKREAWTDGEPPRMAVVGAGPGGLTCAHYLSLKGCKVTVFEADDEPGGMLMAGVPEYRMPRDILKKEIESLLDENVTLQTGVVLGRDITLDGLFASGYKAAFLALGAHRSRRLGLENEEAEGVFPSMRFLKAFNLKQKSLAKGRVAVIGGGNSAIDAARVALRQPGITDVTIYYRRGRDEMPAFPDEIEAALEEGIKLETLVSPIKIQTLDGHVTAVEFIQNELGPVDASGRRSFAAVSGSGIIAPVDTLVVAIGEQLLPFNLDGSVGLEFSPGGTIRVDMENLQTIRPGVFAGGDVVTGPNSVVNAIAAGKRAADMMERYARGEPLNVEYAPRLPSTYIEPHDIDEEELMRLRRVELPTISLEERRSGFGEVELCLGETEAMNEARRCLRCDLEFTNGKRPTGEDLHIH